MKLIAGLTEVPLASLIITKYIKSSKKVDVQWSQETKLVFDDVVFNSDVSICRYLARLFPEYKLYGASTFQYVEVDHWLSFAIGPIENSQKIQKNIKYLDEQLQTVTYLVGEALTIADIFLWSVLCGNQLLSKIEAEKLINIQRWFSFIESHECVKECFDSLPAEIKNNMEQIANKGLSGGVSNERKEEEKFIDLPGAEIGKVVVRFPPEASGMPTNGVSDAPVKEADTRVVNAPERTPDHAKLIDRGLNAEIANVLDDIFKTGKGKLNFADFDERAFEVFKSFPTDRALAVLKQFVDSNLGHVSNKSAYLCGMMKTYRQKLETSTTNNTLSAPKGPDEEKIKAILDRTGYKLEVTTGQRKYGGPPPDWEGSEPGPGCEVFCGKIPEDVFEDELIVLFEKSGKIYDLSLMMDPVSKTNRGYAFITYTTKEEAEQARKDLNNYEIKPGRKLNVGISVPNLRLFIDMDNIQSKDKDAILAEFGQSTENWRKFFKDAGIPSSEAASYASMFVHNRIQMDMLVDLNKHYLNEMGITRIGDVIAILKHGKQIHEGENGSRDDDFKTVLLNKIDKLATEVQNLSSIDVKLAKLEAMIYMKEISKKIHTVIHRSIDTGQYKSKLKLTYTKDIDKFKSDVQEFDRIDDNCIRKPRNEEIHSIGKLEDQCRDKIKKSSIAIGLSSEELRVF